MERHTFIVLIAAMFVVGTAHASDDVKRFDRLVDDVRGPLRDLGGAMALYMTDTATGRTASENDCASRAALGFAALPAVAVAMLLAKEGKLNPAGEVAVTKAHAVGKSGIAKSRLPRTFGVVDLFVRAFRDGDATAMAAMVDHIGAKSLARASNQLGLKQTRLDASAPGGLVTTTSDVGRALQGIMRLSGQPIPAWKPFAKLLKPLKKRVLTAEVVKGVKHREFEGGKAGGVAYRVAVIREDKRWLVVVVSYSRALKPRAVRGALKTLAKHFGAYFPGKPK